jgi:PII-like signaling protein
MRASGLGRFTNSEAIMKTQGIRIARVYLTEADHQLNDIMQYLHDHESISGATAYRGVEGYGASGKMHDSSLVDLSFNLPITIEFFDESNNVLMVLKHLKENFNVSQTISWLAEQHH